MDDKKKLVKVTEQKGTLTLTDENGSQPEYRRPIRTFYVDANPLSLHSGLTEFNADDAIQPVLTRYASGSGMIEDGYISVIGDPDNRAKRISVGIHIRDSESHARAVEFHRKHEVELEEKRKNGAICSLTQFQEGGYYDAVLGFNASDWEIGNDDDWWLQLYVSEVVFDDLATAILKNQITAFKIGITFGGIYTDDFYSPVSMPVNWFLRPREEDGDTRRPELAHGTINVWNIKYATVNWATPTEPAIATATSEEDYNEPREPSVAENTLIALERTTAAISTLGAKVIGAAWLVAIALIIAAFIK